MNTPSGWLTVSFTTAGHTERNAESSNSVHNSAKTEFVVKGIEMQKTSTLEKKRDKREDISMTHIQNVGIGVVGKLSPFIFSSWFSCEPREKYTINKKKKTQ